MVLYIYYGTIFIIIFIQVGTNGLLSFGTGYNSFVTQQFPGNAVIQSLYLVAPFWDDVDIRFGNGDISYEIHETGSFFLDQVNAFIQERRPTEFEGTWMMVVFYDAVHEFSFFGTSLEVCRHKNTCFHAVYSHLLMIYIICIVHRKIPFKLY